MTSDDICNDGQFLHFQIGINSKYGHDYGWSYEELFWIMPGFRAGRFIEM